MDELNEPGWKNFSVHGAAGFWAETGIPECILTHCSCHSWRDGDLVAGWTGRRRRQFEEEHPGLRFAKDGMRVRL